MLLGPASRLYCVLPVRADNAEEVAVGQAMTLIAGGTGDN